MIDSVGAAAQTMLCTRGTVTVWAAQSLAQLRGRYGAGEQQADLSLLPSPTPAKPVISHSLQDAGALSAKALLECLAFQRPGST